MCETCEREQAEREAAEAKRLAALRAAEPKRVLQLSEILRGDPCFKYESRARERFQEAGTVEVTVSLAVEQAADWDWFWAASRLLTQAGYQRFEALADSAITAEQNVLAPYLELREKASRWAEAQYAQTKNRVLDAGGSYNQAYEAADKVWAEEIAATSAALVAARDITQARKNVAFAKAFAEIYISEEGTTEKTGNDRYYARDRSFDEYDEDDD